MSQAGGGGAAIGFALTGRSAANAEPAESVNAATAESRTFFIVSPFPLFLERGLQGLRSPTVSNTENTTGNINPTTHSPAFLCKIKLTHRPTRQKRRQLLHF